MVMNLNLFKIPVGHSTIDSWAKILDDISKVSLLSLPVIIFGKSELLDKIFALPTILLVIYFSLCLSRNFRDYLEKRANNNARF